MGYLEGESSTVQVQMREHDSQITEQRFSGNICWNTESCSWDWGRRDNGSSTTSLHLFYTSHGREIWGLIWFRLAASNINCHDENELFASAHGLQCQLIVFHIELLIRCSGLNWWGEIMKKKFWEQNCNYSLRKNALIDVPKILALAKRVV
jgi:hypothetical protein